MYYILSELVKFIEELVADHLCYAKSDVKPYNLT